MRVTGLSQTAPTAEPSRSVLPWILAGMLLLLASGMTVFALVVHQEPVVPLLALTVDYGEGETEVLTYGAHAVFESKAFFEQVRAALMQEETTFIEADLSEMRVRLYEQDRVMFEAPILSKGRKGSWWETPAGLYAVQFKNENHFSSFGNVYQPWSMAFQGNFFIHGWPHYVDGTPVPEGYSGGCIRLADEDAEALFAQVAVGTPVLVYESAYRVAGNGGPPPPVLDAEAYVVADLATGLILAHTERDAIKPMGSLATLMTALVAADFVNFDRTITVTPAMLASTTVPRLYEGQQLSAYSLLFPLLREGSAEAAQALVHVIGRQRFGTLVSNKANALGMPHTVLKDPVGADAETITTAGDMLTLAAHLHQNRSAVLHVTRGDPDMTAYSIYPFDELHNFNIDENLPSFVGGVVSTSTDPHGNVLVIYHMEIYGEIHPILFVVLGAEDAVDAVRTLHAYVRRYYSIESRDAESPQAQSSERVGYVDEE